VLRKYLAARGFGTFGAALLLDRVPSGWRVALALLLLVPAISVVKSHRVTAKYFFHPSDSRDNIEY
jgi:hypothetical protein